MTQQHTFEVASRQVTGKKLYTLRKENIVPGHIFGELKSSVLIQFPALAFERLYKEVGETGVVMITVPGEKKPFPVMIDEVQMDPLRGTCLHVSFKLVNLNKVTTAEIPVKLIGVNEVRDSVITMVVDSIEVEALPTDLPESFDVDISTLTEIGQEITYNQLSYDASKVKLLVDAEELDTPVVMLQAYVEQAEPEEVTGEPEVIGEKKEDEAEAAPAETK